MTRLPVDVRILGASAAALTTPWIARADAPPPPRQPPPDAQSSQWSAGSDGAPRSPRWANCSTRTRKSGQHSPFRVLRPRIMTNCAPRSWSGETLRQRLNSKFRDRGVFENRSDPRPRPGPSSAAAAYYESFSLAICQKLHKPLLPLDRPWPLQR